MKDQKLALRLDADLSEALAGVAAEEGRSRSQVVRSLLSAYVAVRAESEEDDDDG